MCSPTESADSARRPHAQGSGDRVDQLAFGIALDLPIHSACARRPNLSASARRPRPEIWRSGRSARLRQRARSRESPGLCSPTESADSDLRPLPGIGGLGRSARLWHCARSRDFLSLSAPTESVRFGSPTTARVLATGLTSSPLASRSIFRFIQLVPADRTCPPRRADHGQRFGGLVDQLAFGIALDLAIPWACARQPNLVGSARRQRPAFFRKLLFA